MSALRRVGRTIIATGGVSTPSIERLNNGDILASYRRYFPGSGRPGFNSWNGEVVRSTDGGRTWSDPILRIGPKKPGDPENYLPYYGMSQLADGTILLPCMSVPRGIYMLRSHDNGETWSGPDPVGDNLPGLDWDTLAPYGKIRTLSDGTMILPIVGRNRGKPYDSSCHLRSTDGGETWSEFVVLAQGLVFYNDAIELPDGRMMAMIHNGNSPTGHGMSPLLWAWSEDLGRTWSEPEIAPGPIYGGSPALFMTKNNNLVCGYRWTGDVDQGFLGVGISSYQPEVGWSGTWQGSPDLLWLSRGVRGPYPGRSFGGYPSFTYADDEHILCAFYMSWMGGGDSTTQDIEGVYLVEE